MDYLKVNKASWNNRLKSHLESDFYNLKGFLKGKTSLNTIELDLLGNIKGKKILHLQCHFGQDTISLSRNGAQLTGVDLSDKGISKAKELAEQTGQEIDFICCDIFELDQHLFDKYDIVFTSYGTISWLPDLKKWTDIINHFLLPGGQFIFVEFHPTVWMFDDDMQKIKYNYFGGAPIIEEESGTYADREAEIKQKYVCWNHSLSSVVQNLLNQGLEINSLKEYDYAPYPFLGNMEEHEISKYRIKHFENNVPLVYSILATKKQ